MAVFMPLILILFFGVANLIRPLFMRVRIALDALNTCRKTWPAPSWSAPSPGSARKSTSSPAATAIFSSSA